MRKPKDYSKPLLRIFASYYGPHWKLFALDMVCALLATATDLAFPYVSRICMQTLLPEGLFRTFFHVVILLILAYVIRSVLYFIISYWGHILGVRIEADMREDIFGHIQKLSFSFFDKNRTGVLMSRITTDLFDITELAHHGPENLFISLVTVLGALVVLATIQWRLALILFLIIPIFVLFVVFQRRQISRANMNVKRKTAEINAAIESGISGIRTAKAFAAEETETGKFTGTNEAFKVSKREFYMAFSIFHSGMEFTMSILQVVVIAVGGFLIMRGQMDYIDLITFSLYVSTFISPIRKLAQFVEQFTQGMAGFTRFVDLMRTEPDIRDAADAVELEDVRGEIDYDHVSFGYKADSHVLTDVDLHIDAGECLAVVGPSGGGKTTLCQLLPRFYDVTAGSVSIDGHDVRTVTQASLRKNIGIIQQDVFLFAGTIRENIRYGRPDATDEEVVAAAVRAEIHREIMDLPDGYDTYVGERGVMLSGGQKQRISIARVFLKNPPVLILDEATSALDSVTEARIQKALDELSDGRTCIIIAHRLSTIHGADKIAVIEGEHIQELGSHAELMERGGLYAKLYAAQSFAADGNL
jgi:ATP-binding cassette subfamily B protein